jgi:ribosomal protein S18 acetylase RimI-like enzyme
VPDAADRALLDAVFWTALSGTQRALTVGSETARRYAPGFSPIVAFADTTRPDFAALAPYCAPGERFHCEGWSGEVPAGWQLLVDTRMVRMLWSGLPSPDAEPIADARALGTGDAQQALDLALLTNPGPFGLRTIELGRYVGVFEAGKLVAMAGERLHAGRFREVSGICTHPGWQGRGLASGLTAQVIRAQLARGQVPFLHVMSANTVARSLYRRMGFDDYRETVVRVVARLP